MKHLIELAFISILFVNTNAQTYTGVATHFEALGDPYGGCGVPTAYVDSEHFVALNVFNTPNTGPADYTRPLVGKDTILMGEFANGMNCGRWVKVTIGADCIDGINDGALNQEFCRGTNARWVDDQYSGAELYMVVTDACGDNNGWCRNSQFHLDLHTSSLNKFEKNGIPVGDMYPLHFNNRKITWEYVKAPNYKGDIEVFFMQNAQFYWPAIMINNLENGITAIEQKINGVWQPVKRNSDMGQAFILENGKDFTIRIKDIDGNYINNGREYSFSLPSNTSSAVTLSQFTSYTPPVDQNIDLKQGWNLVSINVIPDTTVVGGRDVACNVSTIFAGLDVQEIKTMNNFWFKNQPDFLNTLKTINPGEGYLVKMNTAGTLNITGIPVETQFIASLKIGWNLIGFPGCSDAINCVSIPFSNYFNPTNYSIIKNLDGFWIPNGTMNSIQNLVPGKAYFIK